jgi:predicted GIY-YIG superfamily endonuclease
MGKEERQMNGLKDPISFVYVLINCKTNEPFYVGTTISFKRRMFAHRYGRRSKNKGSKMAGKLYHGRSGFISVISFIGPRKTALKHERDAIALLKSAGLNLMNQVTGGGRFHRQAKKNFENSCTIRNQWI